MEENDTQPMRLPNPKKWDMWYWVIAIIFGVVKGYGLPAYELGSMFGSIIAPVTALYLGLKIGEYFLFKKKK